MMTTLVSGLTGDGVQWFVVDPRDDGELRVTVSFDAAAQYSGLDTGWLRSSPEYVTTTLREDGTAFARIQTPPVPGSYARKTYHLGHVAGGGTFMLEAEFRAPEPIVSSECGGITLIAGFAEVGSRGVSCIRLDVTREWQQQTLELHVPDEVAATAVHVDLRHLEGAVVFVRNVRLYQWKDGHWSNVGPAIPDTPYVSVAYRDSHGRTFQLATLPIRAGAQPVQHQLPIVAPMTATALLVQAHRGPHGTQGGQGHLVRGLEVRDELGHSLRREMPPSTERWRRYSVFADHPNLAGHAGAAVGLAGIMITRASLVWMIVPLVATSTLIAMTGSRSAMIGFILGVVILLWSGATVRAPRQVRWTGLLGAALLSLLLILQPQVLGRVASLDYETLQTRAAIWRVATQSFLASPWQGADPSDRSSRFADDAHIPLGETVGHAHNYWLELASLLGIFGVAIASWVTITLVVLGWQWAGWHGLAIVLPVLLMQTVDLSIHDGAVILPVIVFLTLARRGGSAFAPSSQTTRRSRAASGSEFTA